MAIGNTATEALSAFLAHEDAHDGSVEKDETTRRRLGDQIEALHLAADLGHRAVDIGPKFKEARHEKAFTASPGGTIWTIRLVQEQAAARAEAEHAQPQATLSPRMAHLLNQLNVTQTRLDRAGFVVESWRERIYVAWHQYIEKAYLSDDRRDQEPPTADDVRWFIENDWLVENADPPGTAGHLSFPANEMPPEAAALVASFARTPAPSAWPRITDTRYNRRLLQSLLPVLTRRVPLALQQVAAPRYWQRNEPVVLLTGAAVPVTDRHGRDGTLRCTIQELAADRLDQLLVDDVKVTVLSAAVDGVLANLELSSGVSVCTHRPWTPFLLEWEVNVAPVGGRSSNLDLADRRYRSHYVTANYELPEHAIEISRRSDAVHTAAHSSTYDGRSLLTPGATVVLLKRIDEYLETRLLAAYNADTKVANNLRIKGYFDEHKASVIAWYRAPPDQRASSTGDAPARGPPRCVHGLRADDQGPHGTAGRRDHRPANTGSVRFSKAGL